MDMHLTLVRLEKCRYAESHRTATIAAQSKRFQAGRERVSQGKVVIVSIRSDHHRRSLCWYNDVDGEQAPVVYYESKCHDVQAPKLSLKLQQEVPNFSWQMLGSCM
jgi:hypothetical protein